jgi:release factor glutamine methyltransferase
MQHMTAERDFIPMVCNFGTGVKSNHLFVHSFCFHTEIMNQIHSVRSLRMLIKNQLGGYYATRELDNMADLLLEEYVGQPRVSLYLEADRPVTEEVFIRVRSAVSRLKKHEPVQYVLGKAHFCDMVFQVNEHVLIPRQETEELVSWIAEDQSRRGTFDALPGILDLGTGSGCIAITLKKKIPDALVTAVDISMEALVVARINADQLGADVLFLQVDMLDPARWEALGGFDIIVSNPPYVMPPDRVRMNANVLGHEPALALYVGAACSSKHLQPGGMIYLEINEQMGRSVCELFRHAGFSRTELRQDIHGKDRIVRISR